MNKGLIDIIIRSYNQSSYIVETIKSVLRQSYLNINIIVVDDGSTDGSVEILNRFKDHIVLIPLEKNYGRSHAGNIGIQHCQGEYIAFIDSDDLWHNDFLYYSVEKLHHNPEYVAVCSAWNYIDENGREIFKKNKKDKDKFLPSFSFQYGAPFPIHSVLLRRKMVADELYFDEKLKYGEDWEMWARVFKKNSNMGVISREYVSYRRHSLNTTKNLEILESEIIKTIDKVCENEAIRVTRENLLAVNYLYLSGYAFEQRNWNYVKFYIKQSIDLISNNKSKNENELLLLCIQTMPRSIKLIKEIMFYVNVYGKTKGKIVIKYFLGSISEYFKYFKEKTYNILSKYKTALYKITFGLIKIDLLQIYSDTSMNRYPRVFNYLKACYKAKSEISILSFGCSSGEECYSLRDYFPYAEITGVDINKKNIKKANTRNSDKKIKFYHTSDYNYGVDKKKYDIILAMSVLCIWPLSGQINEINNVFDFNKYETTLNELDEKLKTGGHIALYNSNYSLEDTKLTAKYQPIKIDKGEDGFVPKYAKNGKRRPDYILDPFVYKKIRS